MQEEEKGEEGAMTRESKPHQIRSGHARGFFGFLFGSILGPPPEKRCRELGNTGEMSVFLSFDKWLVWLRVICDLLGLYFYYHRIVLFLFPFLSFFYVICLGVLITQTPILRVGKLCKFITIIINDFFL